MLTVERLADGEVSPYLVDDVHPGDTLELRGPIGGYFVWTERWVDRCFSSRAAQGWCHCARSFVTTLPARSPVPARLIYSSRSLAEVIYREEFARLTTTGPVEVFLTLTREWPDGWTGHRRRIDEALLREIIWPADAEPLTYRVRSNIIRRERREYPRRARSSGRPDQDRKVRTHRHPDSARATSPE